MLTQDLNDNEDRPDRALWLAAKAAFSTTPPRPDALSSGQLDPLRLAAYLDGQLKGEERDAVEALLAASPRDLEDFLAADGALGATLAAPAGLLARAAALVPGEAPAPAAKPGLLGRLFGGPASDGRFRLQPLVLTLTLAAILVASVAGFEIGRVGYAVAEEGDSGVINTAMAELDGLGLAPDSAY